MSLKKVSNSYFKDRWVLKFEDRRELEYFSPHRKAGKIAPFFSKSEYQEVEHSSLNSEEKWNRCLFDHSIFDEDIDRVDVFISALRSAVKSMAQELVNCSVVDGLEKAYLTYQSDMIDAPRNSFSACSLDSAKQLARYMLHFSRLNFSFYVDKSTGFFGVMLKSSEGSRPLLNLLAQNNGEITFSFINYRKGVIKITGRAHFNDALEDSSEIKNLLRMIFP